MTDAIEKVTLESAAEQLKAKIRGAFVELIPEAQWKEMVLGELKKFMEGSVSRSYHGQETVVPSGLSQACKEVFEAHVKDELKAILHSPEYHTMWQANGRPLISKAIQDWLTDNSAKLIEQTVLSLAGNAAQALLQTLPHRF